MLCAKNENMWWKANGLFMFSELYKDMLLSIRTTYMVFQKIKIKVEN